MTSLTYKTSSGTTLGSIAYTYDVAGQRVTGSSGFGSDLLPTPSTGANTFDLNNRQSAWNGFTLGYDVNGDPTSNAATSPSTTYTFDVRHRLTQISQGSSTIASFSYDALGRRTTKTIGATTTSFLYDGMNPVQETQGGTTNAILTGLGIDERFSRQETAGTRYFLTDALGSTIALTDGSQTVPQTYSYEPYGEVTAIGSSTNPYQYTGRENDGTGLYYYRARYYSPTMKRFISEDPIGLVAGLNEYAYMLGSPTNGSDPLGLEGFGPWTYPPPAPSSSCGCGSDIAGAAASHNGEGGWGFSGWRGGWFLRNKCNLFVCQTSQEGGAIPPMFGPRCATAGEMGDPNIPIPYWPVDNNGPTLGDTASNGVHAGIVVQDGAGLGLESASTLTGTITVVPLDHLGHHPTYRHYVPPGSCGCSQ